MDETTINENRDRRDIKIKFFQRELQKNPNNGAMKEDLQRLLRAKQADEDDAAENARIIASRSAVNPSDPNDDIRQMLKEVENMKTRVEALSRRRGVGGRKRKTKHRRKNRKSRYTTH